jgi:hypothetical protein
MNPTTCFSKKLFGKNFHALQVKYCVQIKALLWDFQKKKSRAAHSDPVIVFRIEKMSYF